MWTFGHLQQCSPPPHIALNAETLSPLLLPPQEFLREHNAAAAAAAQAAAASASGDGADGQPPGKEPQSLWHEMQQRLQAEAAAVEASEASAGPVLQGPGGVLGPDLYMFDGGLFAEEGRHGREQLSRLPVCAWGVQDRSRYGG